MSDVLSETDARLFGCLANPTKTRLTDLDNDRKNGLLQEVSRPHSRASSHYSQIQEEDEEEEVPLATAAEGQEDDVDDTASQHSASHRSDNERSVPNVRDETHYDADDQQTEVASRVSSHMSSKCRSADPHASQSDAGVFKQFFQTRSTAPSSRRHDIGPGLSRVTIQEKQNVLMDIERLKRQGVSFSKDWSLEDSLDDMNYEVRRHMLHMEEQNNIATMRDGMRMICTGVEMLNGRFKVLDLDGWATEICSDMSKYDVALGKLHRKYWRRSYSTSPEMELATSLLMSIGMHHFKRKITSRMFSAPEPFSAESQGQRGTTRNRRAGRRHSPAQSDTSSEGVPP